METKIDSQNMIAQIRAIFPELEESYQREFKRYSPDEGYPTNYIVAGSVLKPYFIQEIEQGKITDFLQRCAKFMESVCLTGDSEAINVIWIKLFEWLIFRRRELKLVWPILGPETKANIRDAALRWSEAARLYGHTTELPKDNIPD